MCDTDAIRRQCAAFDCGATDDIDTDAIRALLAELKTRDFPEYEQWCIFTWTDPRN